MALPSFSVSSSYSHRAGARNGPALGVRCRRKADCARLAPGSASMGYPTLVESFLRAVEQYPTPRAQLERTPAGWEAISSAELLRRVAGLATALERLGVAAGDRVLLYAPNRPEWHTADFAIVGLGAVTVPVYFRESADRLVYIAAHSEAEVAFVSGEEQLRQVAACRAR